MVAVPDAAHSAHGASARNPKSISRAAVDVEVAAAVTSQLPHLFGDQRKKAEEEAIAISREATRHLEEFPVDVCLGILEIMAHDPAGHRWDAARLDSCYGTIQGALDQFLSRLDFQRGREMEVTPRGKLHSDVLRILAEAKGLASSLDFPDGPLTVIENHRMAVDAVALRAYRASRHVKEFAPPGQLYRMAWAYFCLGVSTWAANIHKGWAALIACEMAGEPVPAKS
jgi:hypothetical protein